MHEDHGVGHRLRRQQILDIALDSFRRVIAVDEREVDPATLPGEFRQGLTEEHVAVARMEDDIVQAFRVDLAVKQLERQVEGVNLLAVRGQALRLPPSAVPISMARRGLSADRTPSSAARSPNDICQLGSRNSPRLAGGRGVGRFCAGMRLVRDAIAWGTGRSARESTPAKISRHVSRSPFGGRPGGRAR